MQPPIRQPSNSLCIRRGKEDQAVWKTSLETWRKRGRNRQQGDTWGEEQRLRGEHTGKGRDPEGLPRLEGWEPPGAHSGQGQGPGPGLGQSQHRSRLGRKGRGRRKRNGRKRWEEKGGSSFQGYLQRAKEQAHPTPLSTGRGCKWGIPAAGNSSRSDTQNQLLLPHPSLGNTGNANPWSLGKELQRSGPASWC